MLYGINAWDRLMTGVYADRFSTVKEVTYFNFFLKYVGMLHAFYKSYI